MLTIQKQSVLIHPIIDEFYDDDPNHDRSAGFAVSKGLVSKAPGTTVAPDGESISVTSDSSTPATTSTLRSQRPDVGGHGLDDFSRNMSRILQT